MGVIAIVLGVSLLLTGWLIYMLKYHTHSETKETKRRHDNINHFHNSTVSNDELPGTHVQGTSYEKGYYEDH